MRFDAGASPTRGGETLSGFIPIFSILPPWHLCPVLSEHQTGEPSIKIGPTAGRPCLAILQGSPYRLSIPWRLSLLVLALALPLNLIILGAIWDLVNRANDAQRTSLLYAARSIAAGVDAEFGKFIALAELLARSPALLDDNLDAFEAEARREFPGGGGAWVLVADANGQQLVNTLVQPGQPLPRRIPLAIEAQQRAFATRSIVISDVLQSPRRSGLDCQYRSPNLQGRPALSWAGRRH